MSIIEKPRQFLSPNDKPPVTCNAPSPDVVATAIINLGHSLGFRVVAEGVEREEQLEFLRAQGCDEMQGYCFSCPAPAREAGEMLDPEGDGRRSHMPQPQPGDRACRR